MSGSLSRRYALFARSRIVVRIPKVANSYSISTTTESVPLPQLWLQAIRQVDPTDLDPMKQSLDNAAFLGDKLLGAAAAKYIWHHGLGQPDKAFLGNRQAALLMDVALSNRFFKDQHTHLLPHLETSLEKNNPHVVGTVLEAAVAKVYDMGGEQEAAIDDLAAYLIKNSLVTGREMNVKLQSKLDTTTESWKTTANRNQVSVTATGATQHEAERRAIQQLFESLGLNRVKSLLEKQEDGDSTADLWHQTTKIQTTAKKGTDDIVEESEVQFIFNLLHTTDEEKAQEEKVKALALLVDDNIAKDSSQKAWWSTDSEQNPTSIDKEEDDKLQDKPHTVGEKGSGKTRTSRVKKKTQTSKESGENLWWSNNRES